MGDGVGLRQLQGELDAEQREEDVQELVVVLLEDVVEEREAEQLDGGRTGARTVGA